MIVAYPTITAALNFFFFPLQLLGQALHHKLQEQEAILRAS